MLRDSVYIINLFNDEQLDKLHEVVESNWYYLVYLPVANFIAIVVVGRYILSAMLYPY